MSKKFETKPLGELGARLPVGQIDAGGMAQRDLSFRRWTRKIERQLSSLRKQNPDLNEAGFVKLLLSTLCTQIGSVQPSESTDKKDSAITAAQINSLSIPDVLYAYVYLRTKVMGQYMDWLHRCPECGHETKQQIDLNTMEVDCVVDHDAYNGIVALTEPLDIRGVVYDKARYTIPSWSAMEWMTDTSIAATKDAMVLGGLKEFVGPDEQTLQPTSLDLDELGRYDLEVLSNKILLDIPGPKMVTEMTCPKTSCLHTVSAPIDWQYDSFFTLSGQS